MRYDEQAQQVIRACAVWSRRLGHSYVGSIHLLLAISDSPTTEGLYLRVWGAEPLRLMALIQSLWGRGTAQLPLPQGFSRTVKLILAGAVRSARLQELRKVGTRHILSSLLAARRSAASKLLDAAGKQIYHQ